VCVCVCVCVCVFPGASRHFGDISAPTDFDVYDHYIIIYCYYNTVPSS
jgi:hypothetical protein